jgi:hypothetical protein
LLTGVKITMGSNALPYIVSKVSFFATDDLICKSKTVSLTGLEKETTKTVRHYAKTVTRNCISVFIRVKNHCL